MPVLKLEKQVATGLVRAGLSGRDSVLVVAVSGGTDSVSLLQCLFRLRGEHQLSLHIAHLNHNFRQEADDDAHFVAASARRMGLPATVAKRNPYEHQRKHHISSFEQAARELRYAFLAEVAGEVGAEAVALAHTRDDLAETVLLHLLRGSGLHGLRGMTEISPWPWPTGGHYLRMFRPLLELSKAETRQYCQELDLEYREDPSNYLLRFTRNRLRHELLPLLSRRYNPGIQNALARLARTVALEVDYLEEEVTRVWPLVATHQDQWVSFSRAGLRGLHPLMQRLVLRRGYSTLAGDTARLEETHLNDMAKW